MELADLNVDAIAVLVREHQEGQIDGVPNEADMELAKRILLDAKAYAQSLDRLDSIEESAIQKK
jgi:hypothetical protein